MISKYSQHLIFRHLKTIIIMLLIYLYWFESRQLSVNLSNTQLLHLGTCINIHTYLINFITILHADKVLDLDIITYNDVKYSSDISSIISKARSRNGIIVRSFFSHNSFLLRQAYITLVRPILEYASQVWNPSVLKFTFYLENVQRNFIYCIRSLIVSD